MVNSDGVVIECECLKFVCQLGCTLELNVVCCLVGKGVVDPNLLIASDFHASDGSVHEDMAPSLDENPASAGLCTKSMIRINEGEGQPGALTGYGFVIGLKM